MRYDAEHKQKTRDLVLSEAAAAIRAHGPDGVSVAKVMERAGLTHGGFYAHFASKDAMLVAAIERMFEQSRTRVAASTLDRTPADGLATYISWYLSRTHRDTPDAGCPIAALAADQPRMSEPCREAFAAGSRRLVTTLASLLEQSGHADATALATSVASELVGALSLARIETDPARSDATLKASRTALRARLGLPASTRGKS